MRTNIEEKLRKKFPSEKDSIIKILAFHLASSMNANIYPIKKEVQFVPFNRNIKRIVTYKVGYRTVYSYME